MFGKLGVASEKAKPADYEDAAKHTLGLANSGDLYTVKSKNLKKLAPPPPPEEPEHEAHGGSVGPTWHDKLRHHINNPLHGIPGVHIVGHNPIFHGDE